MAAPDARTRRKSAKYASAAIVSFVIVPRIAPVWPVMAHLLLSHRMTHGGLCRPGNKAGRFMALPLAAGM